MSEKYKKRNSNSESSIEEKNFYVKGMHCASCEILIKKIKK